MGSSEAYPKALARQTATVPDIRERGMPERINQTSLGTMMVRRPLHGVLLLSRAVLLRPTYKRHFRTSICQWKMLELGAG